jgi:hypothetical protein
LARGNPLKIAQKAKLGGAPAQINAAYNPPAIRQPRL